MADSLFKYIQGHATAQPSRKDAGRRCFSHGNVQATGLDSHQDEGASGQEDCQCSPCRGCLGLVSWGVMVWQPQGTALHLPSQAFSNAFGKDSKPNP